MKVNGRTTLYANYTEEEFLSGSVTDQANRVIKILKDIKFSGIHEQNYQDSKYLIDYVYGDQDIKFKEKKTRTDINNKSVENWAYAIVDWKKTYLLGKPVQYAPINDVSNDEITQLNDYMKYENKTQLDKELWEDVIITGRGFRFNGATKVNDEDEAPFEIVNLDPWNTEVIYSSGINKEQLCAFINTQMVDYVENFNQLTGENEINEVPYDEYTVYSRNYCFVIDNRTTDWELISVKPLFAREHQVTEYYINRERVGLIEIGKDILDDINYIENLDLDDIEQNVNAIMVFTNAEVDKDDLDGIIEYGAVSIKSTDQMKASVEILQSRLKSLDTQIFYLRKLQALHDILAVPQAQNNGNVSGGETGKAFLTGQGFTSASVRVEGEELSFKACDRKSLKTLIKICKNSSASIIKNLKVSDIEIKLNRDLSDGMLVKAQTLLTLASANIPPQIRNQVVNLFSDPNSVTKLQEEYEKQKLEIQQQIEKINSKIGNPNQKVDNANNKIQDVTETQEQEQ